MTHPIRLIVGLANPGKEYKDTRHNAGAWFIESLCDQNRVQLKTQQAFHGLTGTTTQFNNQAIHLLVPNTFMNRSGHAVKALMHYHRINPNEILIAHDEIDLPTGIVKLKFDGGDGGHNGLKDVIQHLGTKQFYRLRIGVDRPKPGYDVADYVLHPPSKADRSKIDDAIERAITVLPLITQGEFAKAMQTLHSL